MDELRRQDIRTAGVYEAERDGERKRIAGIKRHRRVNLGDRLSLVFENRETLRNAVEELVRTERIADEPTISAEVDAFNQLLPGNGELAACLYIEVSDPAEMSTVAEELRGVAETVSLQIGHEHVPAHVHLVDAQESEPLTYRIGFKISDRQRTLWRDGASVVAKTGHPACAAETELSAEQRAALAEDLG